MGLYKRKDSNIWQMRFSLNGKQFRKSTKTSNKKAAQRILEKAKVDAAEGKFFLNSGGKMPFDQLVKEVIEKHSKVEKASFRRDIGIGETLIQFFDTTPIEKITSYDIKSWRQWRKEHITVKGNKITKATLNRELSFLKTVFNFAVEWEWLSESPAAKIKKLKGEKNRMRFLNREEVSRLLDCSAPFLKPMIIVAVSTGMRRGEIFNLKWKDIDFVHGFIRVEKSKNYDSRDIPMNSFLSETLKSLTQNRKKESYVFCRENGEKRTDIGWAFRKALKEAGIEDFRFHDLRHTAASLLAAGGCDLVTLKNMLGHRSLLMTQRYAHLIPDNHEKTRRIMQSFWGSKGDTVSVTPSRSELKN